MKRWIVALVAVAGILAPVGRQAFATLSAHFSVYAVDNVCHVEDEYDPYNPFGNTEPPDLIYYAVIANGSTNQIISSCSYCTSKNDTCGYWDLPNGAISANISNGTTARFYFGLFDQDNADADDSVGNHWVRPSTSMSSAAWVWNNDGAYPDYSPVCSDNNEYDDWNLTNNYRLYHRIWYQDDTNPTNVATPDFSDDSISNPTWDNDTTLNVSWAAASDPETGISGYTFDLYNKTTSSFLFYNASAPYGRSMSLCPSGCTNSFTPSHSYEYWLRIRATNGSYPKVNPTGSTESSYRTIQVDLINPRTSITNPTAGSWQRATFPASFTDTDSGAEIDTTACQYQVVSGTTTTRSWTARSYGGNVNLTVGSSSYCRNQGANTCTLSAKSEDLARRESSVASRSFSIDWSQDSITSFTVRTASGGSLIPAPPGWTSDRDPYLSYGINTTARYAPITGYSWAIGQDPDDIAESYLGSGDSYSYQTSANTLVTGLNSVRLRAIDAAGNCGPVTSRDIQVDYTSENPTNVRAFQNLGGEEFASSTWQNDTTPYLTWVAPSSTAPIIGYSYDAVTSGESRLDCSVDTTATNAPIGPLAQGVSTFRLTAIDAAQNCGSGVTFEIWVDSVADPIAGLTARTAPGGSVIPQSTWQPDDSPTMSWSAPSSTSPISGYSYAWNDSPDCLIDTNATSTSFTSVPNGANTFQVSAIDAAGNCGTPSAYNLYVDDEQDPIVDLVAYTEPGGSMILEGQWQKDNDPYLQWSVAAPISPILGYSVQFDGSADCTVDVTDPELTTPEDFFDDGQHSFHVRAIDAAGNCGPESSRTIWVRANAPVLTLQSVTPDPARAGVTLFLQVTSDNTLVEPPTVHISGGGDAVSMGESGLTYYYQYTVQGTEVDTGDPAGAAVTIAVIGEDLAGNPGSTEGSVVFDFNPPELVGPIQVNPPVATTSEPLDIVFESAEPLRSAPPPGVTVDGTTPADFIDEDEQLYTFGYTVSGGEGEGIVQLVASLTDVAGNTGAHLGTFELDLTPPEVTFLYPDHRVVLDLGQEIEIRWLTEDLHPDTVSIQLSTDSGGSFGTTIAQDVPDTGSYTWTVSGDETSLGRFRVIATDMAGLTGLDDSPYDFRIRQPVADHVVAVADDGVATVTQNEQITLSVVDALGDPVAGIFDLSLAVTGSALFVDTDLGGAIPGGNTLNGTTQTDGSAYILVTDEVAEIVEVVPTAPEMPATIGHIRASVRFVPSSADHMVALAEDGLADVDEEEVVTLVAVDAIGNPTVSDVDVRVAVDGLATITATTLLSAVGLGGQEVYGRLRADGTATVRVTDAVTELVTVSGHSDSLPSIEADEAAQVLFVQLSQVDPLQSTIEAIPDIVTANGEAASRIIVTPRNQAGLVIGAGLDVEVLAEFGDLEHTQTVDTGDGTYMNRLSSEECREEPVPIGARIEDVLIPEGASVRFTCLEVGSATLTAQPETIVADSETCAEILLEVFDDLSEPLPPGQAVFLYSSYGTLSELTEPAEGGYLSTLCSNLCADDPILVTAEVNGVSLSNLDPPVEIEVYVECLPVDPVASSLSASPTVVAADGQSASTITVRPIRLDGEEMGPGHLVSIEATLGTRTEPTDRGDGTYTSQLTSIDSGESAVTASVTGIPLEHGATVTFVPPTVPLSWLELVPTVLDLPVHAGDATRVQIELINRLGLDLSSVWISIRPEGGLTLTEEATFNETILPVTHLEEENLYRIELGDLSAATGDTHPLLVVTLQVPEQETLEGTGEASDEVNRDLQATFQAHRSSVVISLAKVVTLTLEDVQQPATDLPGEACSCTTVPAVPWLVLPGLLLIGLGWLRRRRG
ncbi:MAG: hypothetical protein JW797_01030 [Bradymonadales bacterium]|nr:hypothetical protein [Bradymonadales bacterium]